MTVARGAAERQGQIIAVKDAQSGIHDSHPSSSARTVSGVPRGCPQRPSSRGESDRPGEKASLEELELPST